MEEKDEMLALIKSRMSYNSKVPGSKPRIVMGGDAVMFQKQFYKVKYIGETGIFVDANIFEGDDGDFISGERF